MKYFAPFMAMAVLETVGFAPTNAQTIPSQFDLANVAALSRADNSPVFNGSDDLTASLAGEPSQFDIAAMPAVSNEAPLPPDSSAQPSYRRLLPPNMSIMEKWMWGENGLMRETGIVGPLSPQERKGELNLRRTMLTTHQIGGFVTLAFMWSAAYFGQKIVDGHPEFRRNHKYAVTGTIITYSATGLLAILSPPPLIRRDEVSTTTIHKTLAWVHVAGMILTPILGGMVMHRHSTNLQLEHFHQFSGYITTAVFTASMITVTF